MQWSLRVLPLGFNFLENERFWLVPNLLQLSMFDGKRFSSWILDCLCYWLAERIFCEQRFSSRRLYRGCTRDPHLERKGNQGLPLKTTLGSKQLEYFQLDRLITLAVDQFIWSWFLVTPLWFLIHVDLLNGCSSHYRYIPQIVLFL